MAESTRLGKYSSFREAIGGLNSPFLSSRALLHVFSEVHTPAVHWLEEVLNLPANLCRVGVFGVGRALKFG